ncbi:glycosyltransferase family 2 protein [Aequorivita sp. H23M31]|uniref:Glycosyltransferase family 2 protein n=1 Tax=Aequorivita ciconiae TaxID=2494375 RepID=A0A410G6W7_9FLAO|nr:glycosyltransferase family 2 protein [Aequorivita sp. H23M31]QAA83023.1 glycosyltransferase family 2 protein [Aequorivita sp. H23M31]
MSEFTIIIPLYNEVENLLQLEYALLDYIPKSSKTVSILFVNDGSTDGSEKLLGEICKRNRNFHSISFQKNKGLSTALKAGFDWVQSPYLGYMDGDLQTHPEDFNLLLEYCGEYDLVTGIRENRNDTFVKIFSSKIANSIRRLFTQDGIKDTGCPLKVIKTSYAKQIPMFKGLHRFLPAMVLLQKGKIHQIPVRHFPRMKGKRKFGLSNRLFGPLTACFVFLWMKQNYIYYEIKKKE